MSQTTEERTSSSMEGSQTSDSSNIPEKAETPASSSSTSLEHTTSQAWKPTKAFYTSFALICFVFLLSAFECSVVGNVLPSVASDLKLGNAYIWGSIAYLLSSAIVQPFYAQLQDLVGRKLPLLVAIAIFAAGSACCGAAKGKATLITGRVIQGAGTSGIDLIGETIVGDLVPLRFRPKWYGIKQAVFACGALLGPVLGGVFAEKLSWRWVFYMNVPLCVLAGMLIYFLLRLDHPHEDSLKERLKRLADMDLAGISMLALILIFGTVSLSDSHPLGNATAQSLFAAFLMFALAFLAYQVFASKDTRGRVRLFMSPRLFSRTRTAVIGLFNVTVWGAVVYGIQIILPIHLQAVKGRDPMTSGWEMLPITGLLVIFSGGSGLVLCFFGERPGSYKWMQIVGFTLASVGVGSMIALNAESSDVLLFGSMVVSAIGSGIVSPSIMPAIMVELEDADNAIATGNWAFLRSIGSVVGCLLPALCLNTQTKRVVGEISDQALRERLMQSGIWNVASADFLEQLPFEDQGLIRGTFTAGLRTTFIVFTAMTVLALIVTLFMKSMRMREHNDTKFGLQERSQKSASVDEEKAQA